MSKNLNKEVSMKLWRNWWHWSRQLRPACARNRTFLWLLVVLMAFCVREDLLGATSVIRCLGLQGFCYDRILDFFHSPAMNLQTLTQIWTALVVNSHPGLLRYNGRLVLVGDGIKVAKSGKKMPAVKRLHQESESNTKPKYIMGHSCQAICILAQGLQSIVAIPLAARIHEGVVFSNRDKRTLLDKMIILLDLLLITEPFYFVVDAYYASRKIIAPLLKVGNHLITRVRHNSVGYRPAPIPKIRKVGRPKKYGLKIKIWSLFNDQEAVETIDSPLYGEKDVKVRIRSVDLLWKPVGILVRFVAVDHPNRGKRLLMSTDLTLPAIEILRLYGFRFKIEIAFKNSLHVVGAFLYHFWLGCMKPLKRNSGDQYLHRQTEEYRDAIRRKMDAYHRFIQIGLIAQGIMQAIATTVPQLVWRSFGSWLRTIRPGLCPSELVVSTALRNTLPEFLADETCAPALTKFLRERIDLSRIEGTRLVA